MNVKKKSIIFQCEWKFIIVFIKNSKRRAIVSMILNVILKDISNFNFSILVGESHNAETKEEMVTGLRYFDKVTII